MKSSVWKCDFKGCEEIAQWYRWWKGDLFKLCSKHEAYFARQHWGKHLDISELDEDDIRYLEEKDEGLEEKGFFEVLLTKLGDGTFRVKVIDRETDEKRSFVTDDIGRLLEIDTEFRKKGKLPVKPSIDDFVKRLRKEEEQ